MNDLRNNPRFAEAYAALAGVRLNPRRHTAANAHVHSEQVSNMAGMLGAQNGCSAEEISILENLGRAHDIGKIEGTAHPRKSLDVLAECGALPAFFLALVKWHDTSLPWWKAAQRGQAPSAKAWSRLARDVDMRLLCMFMVADRVDAPPGWRRNAPTIWMLDQARRRGLVSPLRLDVDGHPSEVSAGAVLVRDNPASELLVIRVRREGYELPKGGIEWDELPHDASVRELREEAGVTGELTVTGDLGHVDYDVKNPAPEDGVHRKRVTYARVEGAVGLGPLPAATRERRWINREQATRIPLVNEQLRPIMQAALGCGAR